MRESRSIATSGRLRGWPKRSSYVKPCSASASRACCVLSHASAATVRSRTWCGSKSQSRQTVSHQVRVGARRCSGASACVMVSPEICFQRGRRPCERDGRSGLRGVCRHGPDGSSPSTCRAALSSYSPHEASTIATMPALIASGRSGHALTTFVRPGGRASPESLCLHSAFSERKSASWTCSEDVALLSLPPTSVPNSTPL